MVATTGVDAPGRSVPPAGDTVSQTDVLTRLQFNEAIPALETAKLKADGAKLPPTAPPATELRPGLIRKSSGASKDSCTPEVVELEGDVAPTPMPRLAKATHNKLVL